MVSGALLFYTCFLGLTGIIAGGIASHGLEDFPVEARESFKLGAHYHQIHGLAVVGAVALAEALRGNSPRAAKRVTVAAWLLAIGTTLFSGVIYAMVFGAPTSIGFFVPTGGFFMMGGWCVGMIAAFAL